MLNGLDPAQCPEWVAECEATLHTIEQLRPGYRIFWLSVPLANDGTTLSTALRTARSNIEATLGLPAVKPSAVQLKVAGMRARQVAESIPAPFHPIPATPAQMVWLHQHMIDRGQGAQLRAVVWPNLMREADRVGAVVRTATKVAALAGRYVQEMPGLLVADETGGVIRLVRPPDQFDDAGRGLGQ